MSYHKKIDKAKKLKALADRGDGGEMDSARDFYYKYLKEHGIAESEIDDEVFKRRFRLLNNEYEILLSHIIMSVNPFCIIDRTKAHEYIVTLDDEDFIEVEYKFMVFNNLFNEDEKRILKKYAKLEQEKYQKEKLVLLTSFLEFHKRHLSPDLHSVAKQRSVTDGKINPDMAESVKEVINLGEKTEKDIMDDKVKEAERQKKRKQLDEQESVMLTQSDIEKMKEYSERFTDISYVRARKSLIEK